MPRTEMIKDGQTYEVKNGEYIHEICCDCNLAHLVRYWTDGKKIYVTAYRDDVETAERRKKKRKKGKKNV